MERLDEMTLQRLCQEAYDLLKQRWAPEWWFIDPLKFDELNPCGQAGDRVWFCGDVRQKATPRRYVCIATPVLEYQGHASDFETDLCTFPHNTYLDLLFIRMLIQQQQLQDPDLFRRDQPPPEWLKQLGLHQ